MLNRLQKLKFMVALREPKKQNAAHCEVFEIPLSILLILPVSLAVADDIKTNYGKEYRNATVTRVEPDGIMIKLSGGLLKIPFKDLSDELKQKYHYNSEQAGKFVANTAAQINAHNANADPKQSEANLVPLVTIFAIIK